MGWQYVVPGYLTVFGGLAIYTLFVLRRAKTLNARVDPDKRRFLD